MAGHDFTVHLLCQGTQRPTQPDLKCLRTTQVLKEGMCLTIEPGIYFMESVSRFFW